MNDVTKDLLEALLNVARMAEKLKKPCGTDPESPQAIRNAQYMNISYAARAAIARAEAALSTPQPDSSVWVLTSSCNDYDQHGEYFEAVFKDKPTRESIMEACGVTEEGADHILLGGGRKGDEYMWFNLRQEALP